MTMNSIVTPTRPTVEQTFFVSELLGTKILIHDKKVGKLRDLVIKENGSLPVVTHFFISLPFGVTAIVPWEKIGTVSLKGITVDDQDIAPYQGEPEENAVLLRDHVLDKEIIDMDGKGIVFGNSLALTKVDPLMIQGYLIYPAEAEFLILRIYANENLIDQLLFRDVKKDAKLQFETSVPNAEKESRLVFQVLKSSSPSMIIGQAELQLKRE
jgi:hypothetical protein